MDSFDYVIVGGGTAGCILAARLTETGRHSVLLLEAGGKPSSMWISIPAGFTKLLVSPRFNWKFETEPDDNKYGRAIVVPRGKGLGGSTLINGMIYVRGQAQDYDGWAQRGARGWSFDDVLPYFRKLEQYDGPDPDGLRGRGGPMNIVEVTERNPVASAFVESGREAGHAVNVDYNGRDQAGVGYYQVTQKDGRRWSVVDGYLRPAMSRPNLTVVTSAHVTRLLLEGRRAVGVAYRRGNVETQVRAKGEVLLTAGAVQTPQLLELSGIGAPETLKAHGVEVRVPQPAVGENYIDHFATRMNWRVRQPITLNEMSRGWRLGREVLKYFLLKKGILTLGTGMSFGFVKTRPDLETPDVQYFFVHASYANAADRLLDKEPGMTIGVSQLRPQSRGSIHIKSPDPMAAPSIRPNFLSAAIDREAIVEGMKIARHIIGQPAMGAYRLAELSPGPAVTADEDWLDFAYRNGQTIYHPVGTCRMGADGDAVVDTRLRFNGIEGLRVVDASVMPAIVSGNTQAAVMMIAEKAADMIRDDARNA